MPYIDLAGLSRYASRQKEWLERDYALLRDMQWTRSEKAGAVSLWPVGGTPLLPTVDFLFSETGPASGDKGPDNPSTITGVSTITVTRCETVGVDSTDYTLPLGSTFYGGTLDVATGVMTVTHGRYIFTGNERGWSNDGSGGLHSYNETTALGFTQLNLNNYITGTAQDGNSSCTHLPYAATSEANVQSGVRTFACYCLVGSGKQLRFIVPFSTISDLQAWLSAQNANGTPVAVTYKLATPYTVQLDPVSISALAQVDKYTPRLNTVYTDASAVQVGYVKSPIREEYELQQAVIAQGGNV